MAIRRPSRTASSCASGSLRKLLLASAVLGAALAACGRSEVARDEPAVTAAAAAVRMRVEVMNSAASVHAREVPLDTVLAELAVRSGLRVVAYAPLAEPVTVAFEGLPLHDALRQLLGQRAYLLIPPMLYVFATGPSQLPASRPAAASAAGLTQRLDALSATPAGAASLMTVLTDTAATDPAALMREAAIDALGDIDARDRAGNARRTDVLRAGLGDADRDVRLAALRALARVGDASAVQALATVLHDSDPRLRAEAVDALGSASDPGAVPLLQQALSDPHPAVREAAHEWLAERAAR